MKKSMNYINMLSVSCMFTSSKHIYSKIKTRDKILQRFNLVEIIFKYKKMNKALHIRSKMHIRSDKISMY